MSQAIGSNIRVSSARAAISTKEMFRVLAQNLNSAQFSRSGAWLSYFKPLYDQRKASYSSNLDTAWPVDAQNGWFRAPTNIQIIPVTGTSFTIQWETNLPSDSEVAYTSNGSWWYNPYHETHPTTYFSGPDGIIGDPSFTTFHSITLSGLNPNTDYNFRIRSSNRAADILNEILWGSVDSFTTEGLDADGDGLRDDWEVQYFGNITSQNGLGDPDNDSLINSQEFARGTDPTNPDSDFDGFSDGVEVADNTGPLDWSSHSYGLPSCNNNGICENAGGESFTSCPNDCDPDLVAYWSFDHCNAWDQSGNHRNGTVVGATCQATGGHNGSGAFSFRGGVSGPDHIRFDSSLSALSTYGGENSSTTVVAWVKPDYVNQINIVTQHLGGFDYFSAGSSSSYSFGHLVSMVRNGSNQSNSWPTSTGTIAENEWHQVAFVFESGVGWKYYIDGSLAGESSNPALILHDYSDASDLHAAYIGFGWQDEPGHFAGLIDDVSIWKKALTADKICVLAGKTWNSGNCS